MTSTSTGRQGCARPCVPPRPSPRPAPTPSDQIAREHASILDRAPAIRSDKATARLLRLLDSLPARDEGGEA
jgi:hypothetical protein